MPNHCDWNLFSVCSNYPSNHFTTSEYNQIILSYSHLLEKLDHSLDTLSIDLMDKTWNELQELDKLSKIN